MATLLALKSGFQSILRPAVHALARAGVSPNAVTLGALAVSVAVGAAVARSASSPRALLLLPAWMVLRIACNTVDGMLAVATDRRTPFGAVLNEAGDVIADAALILPLACVPGVAPGPVVVAVVLAAASENAGVAAVIAGADRRYDGPLTKPDRTALYGGIALALGCGVAPGAWTAALFVIGAALSAITMARRIRAAALTAASRSR